MHRLHDNGANFEPTREVSITRNPRGSRVLRHTRLVGEYQLAPQVLSSRVGSKLTAVSVSSVCLMNQASSESVRMRP